MTKTQFLILILKVFFLQFLNVCRYGIRGCYRHLCYLSDLLDKCEKQIVIDPTLIHFSYAYCASHVHGNRYVFFRVYFKGTVSIISIDPPRIALFTREPFKLLTVDLGQIFPVYISKYSCESGVYSCVLCELNSAIHSIVPREIHV